VLVARVARAGRALGYPIGLAIGVIGRALGHPIGHPLSIVLAALGMHTGMVHVHRSPYRMHKSFVDSLSVGLGKDM